MTALLIGEAERAAIAALAQAGEANPVDIQELIGRIRTDEGKRAHMDQMSRQTIALPEAWLVTYSIETGHPAGRCRHVSVRFQRRACAPARGCLDDRGVTPGRASPSEIYRRALEKAQAGSVSSQS